MRIPHYIKYTLKILESKEVPYARGTGFFVSQNGYLLTCFHVIKELVEKDKPIYVEPSSSFLKGYQKSDFIKEAFFQKKFSNVDKDIAVLKVEGTNFPFAPLGIEGNYGDLIESFGYQYQLNSDEFKGENVNISGFTGRGFLTNGVAFIGHLPLIMLENINHIHPGLSGAPAFNTRTQKVIGIVHARLSPTDEEVGLIIPIKTVFENWMESRVEIEEESWMRNLKAIFESKEITKKTFYQILESSKLIPQNLSQDIDPEEVYFFLEKEFLLWDAEQKQLSYLSLPIKNISEIKINNSIVHRVKCSLKFEIPLIQVIDCFEFIYVPPGKLKENFNLAPKGYYLLSSFVSNGQWAFISNALEFNDELIQRNPKVNVSYSECCDFIEMLNMKYPEMGFNIPTENELKYFSEYFPGYISSTISSFEEICVDNDKHSCTFGKMGTRRIQPLLSSDNLGFRITLKI